MEIRQPGRRGLGDSARLRRAVLRCFCAVLCIEAGSKVMSSPTFAPKPNSCAITIGVFDGSRQPLGGAQQVLFTVRDGNQNQVYREFQQAASLTLKDLPFFDNFGDTYTVIAWADGYEQAGFTPVKTSPGVPAVADLMLLRKESSFNF